MAEEVYIRDINGELFVTGSEYTEPGYVDDAQGQQVASGQFFHGATFTDVGVSLKNEEWINSFFRFKIDVSMLEPGVPQWGEGFEVTGAVLQFYMTADTTDIEVNFGALVADLVWPHVGFPSVIDAGVTQGYDDVLDLPFPTGAFDDIINSGVLLNDAWMSTTPIQTLQIWNNSLRSFGRDTDIAVDGFLDFITNDISEQLQLRQVTMTMGFVLDGFNLVGDALVFARIATRDHLVVDRWPKLTIKYDPHRPTFTHIIPPNVISVGSEFNFTFTAVDDNDLTMTWFSFDIPFGATLDENTGQMLFTPTIGQQGTTFRYSIGVFNSDRSITVGDEYVLQVVVEGFVDAFPRLAKTVQGFTLAEGTVQSFPEAKETVHGMSNLLENAAAMPKLIETVQGHPDLQPTVSGHGKLFN